MANIEFPCNFHPVSPHIFRMYGTFVKAKKLTLIQHCLPYNLDFTKLFSPLMYLCCRIPFQDIKLHLIILCLVFSHLWQLLCHLLFFMIQTLLMRIHQVFYTMLLNLHLFIFKWVKLGVLGKDIIEQLFALYYVVHCVNMTLLMMLALIRW